MITQNLIIRNFHGTTIRQRNSDGYFDATSMCKATGKLFKDYSRLKSTKEFLTELSKSTRLPVKSQKGNSPFDVNKGLVEITCGGNDAGTWVHSKIAIHLAIWCNPEFAVLVTEWVYELLTQGSVSLNSDKPNQDIITFAQAKANELDKLGIIGNAKQIAINNFIKQQFGCDILQIFGIESQPAKIQQALLNPTKIAERVSLKSAIAVNKELIVLGLQTKHYDKKNIYYELTKKGIEYGQYQDTGIRKISKTIRIIKWYESVLKLFQPALQLF